MLESLEILESPRVKSLVALIELRQYTNMDLNTLMEMQEELSTLGESGLYDNVFEDSLYDKVFGDQTIEDDDLPVVDSSASSDNTMAIYNVAVDVSTIVKVSSTDDIDGYTKQADDTDATTLMNDIHSLPRDVFGRNKFNVEKKESEIVIENNNVAVTQLSNATTTTTLIHTPKKKETTIRQAENKSPYHKAWALSTGSKMRPRGSSIEAGASSNIAASKDIAADVEDSIPAIPTMVPSSSSSVQSNASSTASAAFISSVINPTPRIARYLCLSSILLAVCSLGLAATGLGLVYFRNKDDSTNRGISLAGNDVNGFMVFESGNDIIPQAIPHKIIDMDESEVLPTNPTLSPVKPTLKPTYPILEPATLLSTTLFPIADTWIEFDDFEPHGLDEFMMVDADPVPRVALLKFNLSNILSEANIRNIDVIVGYTLRLYSITDSPFGGDIELLGDDCNDWDEVETSWMNAPECIFNNDSETILSVGRFQEEVPSYEWNEAVLFLNFDAVFDMMVLPEMITLRVSSSSPDGITYSSRENVTAMPELVVYYTEPTPTSNPTLALPSKSPVIAPSFSPVVIVPTAVPTDVPTYLPTSTEPTLINNTTSSPSASPPSIIIPVTQDAMIRDGDFADSSFGKDPYMALHDGRKVILEFDLSTTADPSIEYEYSLQIFVTYVAENEVRSIISSCIWEQDFGWNDDDITWDNFGTPTVNEVGWFEIFREDEESLVNVPLGKLDNCTISDNRIILLLESLPEESGLDKFDFRSKEYAQDFPGMTDTPPTLVVVPNS